VHGTRPIEYCGEIVDEFWLKLVDGVVVEYDAKVGKSQLTKLLSQEGANMIGEIAVVEEDCNNVIQDMLWYDTSIDENAGCHMALGAGYPDTVKCSPQEVYSYINSSPIHLDFVFGNASLAIVGYNQDRATTIMQEGKLMI
jgi:aminopeptidase